MVFTVKKACPVLTVRDVQQAIEEYQQYGFTLVKAFGSVHAIVSNGQAELHLSCNGPIGKQSVWLVVDDLDTVEKALKPVVPADHLEPIQDQPHGYRELSMMDASGNILVFAQSSG